MTEEALAPDPASRPHQLARAALALLLTAFGLWTLHSYLPALIWAAILAIAVWPLYVCATRRWPPGRHNVLLPMVFTLALGLMFVGPLVVVAVQAGREVHGVFESITQARTEGIPPPQWLAHLPVGSQQATTWWRANLEKPESANALLQRARESEFMSNGRELTGENWGRYRSPGGVVRLHAADIVLFVQGRRPVWRPVAARQLPRFRTSGGTHWPADDRIRARDRRRPGTGRAG
jgi:hypothetical protein